MRKWLRLASSAFGSLISPLLSLSPPLLSIQGCVRVEGDDVRAKTSGEGRRCRVLQSTGHLRVSGRPSGWTEGQEGGGRICSFGLDSLLCLFFSFLTFSVSLHPVSFPTPLSFICPLPLPLAHTTALSYSICAISALAFTFRWFLFPSACCVRAGWGWCGLDGPEADSLSSCSRCWPWDW